ncbi:hypothetical protein N7539_002904 [Penicillium diatomitis]|uniref:Uncharacterized protein n=1 Tax=Penicillium diatomitis TaxID=2819901 RepID=A0A9X0BZM6_9EURO|nr:uncharacterized protein N7539_002904 [Penicillium diatomitis]KAJ5491337.1 hypothetical protein N7539_002904 [Penicillium diatomitis]
MWSTASVSPQIQKTESGAESELQGKDGHSDAREYSNLKESRRAGWVLKAPETARRMGKRTEVLCTAHAASVCWDQSTSTSERPVFKKGKPSSDVEFASATDKPLSGLDMGSWVRYRGTHVGERERRALERIPSIGSGSGDPRWSLADLAVERAEVVTGHLLP